MNTIEDRRPIVGRPAGILDTPGRVRITGGTLTGVQGFLLRQSGEGICLIDLPSLGAGVLAEIDRDCVSFDS